MTKEYLVKFYGASAPADYHVWWEQHRIDSTWGNQAALLAYLTPEQQADFTEYGGFMFETGDGRLIFWHISSFSPFGCLQPGAPLTRIQWMIAAKLVWQAAAREISCVVGRGGRTLP